MEPFSSSTSNHPGRIAAGQAGEVHRGLGVAGATKHTPVLGTQREDVARHGEVLGLDLGIDQRADGDGAVVGRGPGRHPPAGVDRHREGGAHGRRVLRDHHAELQLVQPLPGHRHADEAAPVCGHEVHRFRRSLLGGQDQIALVLSVLVVDDQQETSLADLLQGLPDRDECAHGIPLSSSERCRYLPITSVSRFTAWPRASRPNVVTASVCGITITSNTRASRAAIVRLTPSTATEPCRTSSGAKADPGSAIRTRAVDSTRVTSSTVPIPSTWPRTRCPPTAAPNRNGRSRLTASPAERRPSVVRLSVSGPTSNASASGLAATTVRQTPFTATLAPTSLPSRATCAATARRTTSPCRSTARTVAISSTIPVNIRRARRRLRATGRRRAGSRW